MFLEVASGHVAGFSETELLSLPPDPALPRDPADVCVCSKHPSLSVLLSAEPFPLSGTERQSNPAGHGSTLQGQETEITRNEACRLRTTPKNDTSGTQPHLLEGGRHVIPASLSPLMMGGKSHGHLKISEHLLVSVNLLVDKELFCAIYFFWSCECSGKCVCQPHFTDGNTESL